MRWRTRLRGSMQGDLLTPFVFVLILCASQTFSQTAPTNPVITAPLSANEGTQVTFNCTTVNGNPLPSVTWYKGSNVVDSTYSTGGQVSYNEYTFTASRSDHGVSYRCEVYNVALSSPLVRTWLLTVYVQPNSPTISGPSTVNSGNTYTYSCVSSGGNPAPNINWRLDTTAFIQGIQNSIVPNNDNTYTVTSNLTWVPVLADNGKALICEVEHSQTLQTKLTDSITITVQVLPVIVTSATSYSRNVGESVTLNCSVSSANPAVTQIRWTRTVNSQTTILTINGVKYSGATVSNPSLTINSLQTTDAGQYQCQAINTVGTGSGLPISLAVTGSIFTSQVVSIVSINYAVDIGKSVTLECVVVGIASSLSWQRVGSGTNGTIVIDNNKYSGGSLSSPSLTINNATLTDEGTYRCLATVSGNNQSAETFVDVVGSIPSVTIPFNTYSVSVGNSVTMVCDVVSTLSVTNVYWQRNTGTGFSNVVTGSAGGNRFSGSTVTSPSLVLLSATASDAGSYKCFATNSAGTGESSITSLSVQGNVPTVQTSQTSYTVNQGNTVTLVCSVSSSTSTPVTSVQWQRINGGVTTNVATSLTSKYSGSTVSTPSLTILNIQSSDAGSYRCTATNTVGTGQGLIITLNVNVPPTINLGQSSYSVNYGSTVTLGCSISSNSAILSVTWQQQTTGGSTITVPTSNTNKYSGGTPSSPNLVIFNADLNDVGNYRCLATSSAGTGQSNFASLTVVGSVPTVSITSASSLSVAIGNTITISCSVSSNPAATSVSWIRTSNGVATTLSISSNSRYSGGTVSTPSLTITNAQLSDEGSYQCRATNSAGTGNSGSTFLDVTGSVPTVVTGSGSTVTIGNSVTVSCSISGSPSHTSVTWTREVNGVTTTLNIASNSRYSGGTVSNPSLAITNVQDSDEGSYRCSATNTVGTGQSSTTAFINVQGGVPSVVIGSGSSPTVGTTATITCSVSGSPSATSVSWERTSNGVTTTLGLGNTAKYSGGTVSVPSLTIFNVQTSDSGNYVCKASNSVGTGSSGIATLNVVGSIPSISVPLGNYSVNFGSSVTLQCTVNSIPTATSVTWQKIAGGVTTEIIITSQSAAKYGGSTVSSPSLVIFSADLNDEGGYVCTADNSVGTGYSSQVYLDVIASTPTVQIASSTYTVSAGNTASLVCTITSQNPPATSVTWQRFVNGVTSTIAITGRYSGGTVSSPTLVISNAQQSDEGTYFCFATNSVGQGQSAQTFLDIQTLPVIEVGNLTYTADVGTNVTLQCNITASPQISSVTWQRTVGGVTSVLGISSGSSKYSGGSVSVPSLTVHYITTSDEGFYSCSATNDAGVGSGPEVYLDVLGSLPSVTIPISTYSGIVSNQVILDCTVTSEPPAYAITWKRILSGGTTIVLDPAGSSKYSNGNPATPAVTISDLEQSDEGNYFCEATNVVGTGISSTTFLDVVGSAPSVTIPSSSYPVNYGGTTTIVCNVVSTPSVTTITWYRVVNGVDQVVAISGNSRLSGGTPSVPSLTVTSATFGDEGSYRCEATNVVGSTKSTATFLDVIGSSPIVNIQASSYSATHGDSSITIVCTVTANPSATSISWQQIVNSQSRTLNIAGNPSKYAGGTINNPSLTIYNLNSNDTGYYVCSATNAAGTTLSGSTLLNVAGNFPNVIIGSAGYSSVFGSNALLSCSVSANPSATAITWTKVNADNSSSVINVASSRYDGGTLTTPSLTIFSLVLSDSGRYICSATNPVGTASAETQLTVQGAVPNVTVSSTSYSILYGTSVTLNCTYSAFPTATGIQWQRIFNSQSNVIDTSLSKYSGGTLTVPSLTISNTDFSDAADYVCSSTNAVGTGLSQPISLTITGNTPSVSAPNTAYSPNYGSSVTLQCTATATPSITTVYWTVTRNGVSTNITIATATSSSKYSGVTLSNPSLIISSLTLSDEGSYVCYAINSVGSSQSSPINLDVIGDVPSTSITQSQYSVNVGNSVTLQCIVSSTPAATSITWQRTSNGVTTTLNVGSNRYSGGTISVPSLTVLSAQTSDAGTYSCVASNSVGSSSPATSTLTVVGAIPSVDIQQSVYTSNVGGTITLACIVTANPSATSVSWTRVVNGATTNIDTTSSKYSGSTTSIPSLTIFSLELTDEGSYSCQATNSLGTGQSGSTYLDVTGSIPTVTIPLSTYSVNVGFSVTIPCSVSSSPSATSVTWQRVTTNGVASNLDITGSSKYAGGEVSSPSLVVFNSEISDSANYRCLATNSIGTGQSNLAYLDVIGNLPTVSIPQSSYSVNYGSSVTINCTYTSNPAASSVSWQRTANGVSTVLTITGSSKYSGGTLSTPSLVIFNAVDNDEGFYTCSVTNAVGTASSSSAFLDVVATLPTVSIPSSSYSVNYGSTITIPCFVSANPTQTSVQWRRTTNGVTTTLTITGRYSGATINTPSLTISNAVLTDEGSYVCYATNAAGTGNSSPTTLDVLGNAPTVNIPNTQYTVTFGSAVTIPCFVTGNPTATSITWVRISGGVTTTLNIAGSSGKYSGGSVSSPTLTISNTDNNDEGTYRCSATNDVGTTQDSAFLDVQGNTPAVSIPQSTYSVNYGSSVVLACQVSGTPSATSVNWYRILNSGSSLITVSGSSKYSGSTTSNPSLTISNAQLTDEGSYQCTATNSVGTGTSSTTFLDVIGSVPSVSIPQSTYSVTFGQDVTITCIVSSNPSATSVTWELTRNSVTSTLSLSNTAKYSGGTTGVPSLTIRNAAITDEGSYRCRATNAVGTGQSSLSFLDVTGTSPSVTIPSSSYSVNYGNTITIPCSVTATPAVTAIAWYKDSSSSAIAISGRYSGATVSSPSLTITSAVLTDEGNYRCSATNIVGTGNSLNTYLDVVGNVPSVSVSQSQVSVVIGNNATITCSYSANPTATAVLWQRTVGGVTTNITIGGRISGGSLVSPSLIITNAQTSDEGSYRCLVGNAVGQGQSSLVFLDVTGSVPSPNIPQNTYTVITGSSVTLQCTVTATPTATNVYWQISETPSGAATNITATGPKYSGGTIVTPALTINDANYTLDEGYYRCLAENAAGVGQSGQTFLDVTGNTPTVTIPSSTYSANFGSNVTLPCTISSNPSATSMRWEKTSGSNTDIVITSGSNKYSGATLSSPSLTIHNVDFTDQASYRCIASNQVGDGFSISTFLTIQGSIPSVSILQSTYQVTLGNSLTIQCTVSSSLTVTSITWQFLNNQGTSTINVASSGGKYSGGTVSSPSLVINNAANSDEGSYRCTASNSAGTGQSQLTYVDVVGSAPSVSIPQRTYQATIGSTVTLTCTASGSPPVTSVFWQRVKSEGVASFNVSATTKYGGATVNSPSLIIYNVSTDDEAQYRCLATNSAGTGQSWLTFLDVTGSVPIVTILSNQYTVLMGNTITLHCQITALPGVTGVTWEKLFQGTTSTINPGQNSKYQGGSIQFPSLVINDASLTDSALYRCLAENAIGTGYSGLTHLQVVATTPAVNIPYSVYRAKPGFTVTIHCTVTSPLTVTTVEWYKIRNGVKSYINTAASSRHSGGTVVSPSLTITDISPEDSAVYVCLARNSAGQGQSGKSVLHVVGSTPVMSMPRDRYTAVVNRSVTLECLVLASPPTTSVTWQRTKTGVTQTLTTYGSAKYSGGSPHNPSLTIYNVAKSDEADYVCLATNMAGNSTSESVHLKVVSCLPNVTVFTPSQTAVYGSNVTILCSVMAYPVPVAIYWHKTADGNSTYIFPGNSSARYGGMTPVWPSLQIADVDFDDEGIYDCIASNVVGTTYSSGTSLIITGYSPNVNIPNSLYSALIGNSVQIPCTITANPATTQVYWIFNPSGGGNNVQITQSTGRYTVSTNSNNPTLSISNLAFSDEGSYTCTATNIVGTGTDSATLNVTGSAPSVTVNQTSYSILYGESVTLHCTVTAIPNVTSIYWSKSVGGSTENITMTTDTTKYGGTTTSNPSLEIYDLIFNDTGSYVCIAMNLAGMGQSPTISLVVDGSAPSVTVNQTSYSIIYGESVTLHCTVTAIPNITSVYWSKSVGGSTENITMTTDTTKYGGTTISNPSLEIYDLVFSDDGSYVCIAMNLAGMGQSRMISLVVQGSAPSVTVNQTSYSIIYGESVTLHCTVTAIPNITSVYWSKSVGGSTENITMATNTTKYGGTTISNPSLEIYDLVFSDDGSYVCIAMNLAGMGQSRMISLVVQGSVPSVVITLPSYSVLTGGTITIPCSSTAVPALTTRYWVFDPSGPGNNLRINSTGGRYSLSSVQNMHDLTISNTVTGDAGTYTCFVTNIVGTSSDSATLATTGDEPNITVGQTSYSLLLNRNVTLACTVGTAQPAVQSVAWIYRSTGGSTNTVDIAGNPGKYSGGSLSTPSLTIFSLTDSDEGYYTCTATNLVGRGNGSEIFLNVSGLLPAVSIPSSSYSTLQGTNITLTCSITNTPSPAITTVTWYYSTTANNQNPTTVDISNTARYTGGTNTVPSLIITGALPADQGYYRCAATNAVGTVTSGETYFTVTGSAPSAPTVSQGSSVTISQTNTLTLQCSASGDPTPTITWSLNGQTLTSTNGVYTKVNAQRVDDGVYTCTASNSLGTQTSTVNVDVQFAPVATASTVSLSVASGSEATLTCAVEANPTASYQWSRNNVVIGTNSRTYTATFGTGDFGEYICQASNSLGSTTVTFTVSQSSSGSVGAATASSGLSAGEIAAIVLAVLLLLLLIIVLCICCCTHGVCGMICGKKKEPKGRVEPSKEKEVYKETIREVEIPRFEEKPRIREDKAPLPPISTNYRREPSAVSRKDVDVRVNHHYRKENDYDIIRYETVPPTSTRYGDAIISVQDDVHASPRPHRLPALTTYTYNEEDRRRKRRKRKKKHHRRHHHDDGEEVIIEKVRTASPVRLIEEQPQYIETVRTASPVRIIEEPPAETVVVERVRTASPVRYIEEPTQDVVADYVNPNTTTVIYSSDDRSIVERVRRSPSARRRRSDEEEMIVERSSRSPSRRRRHEEHYVTTERVVNGDVYRDSGEYTMTRHGSGRYVRDRGADRHRYEEGEDVEVVPGEEYYVERR